jgi:glycosyltransferase involved in cell wall biosynthesis
MTPMYNVENYLERTLDSLANQTYPNCEFILCDDGSTDDTLLIAQSFADNDPRFVVLQHAENRGNGAGQNTCLNYALDPNREYKPKYIAFCDHDDIMHSDLIEHCVGKMQTHDVQTAEMLLLNYCTADVHFENTPPMPIPFDLSGGKLFSAQNDATLVMFPPPPWAKFYDADFIRKNNIRFTENKGLQYPDIGWGIKCAAFCRYYAYTPNVLYTHFVNRAKSISTQNSLTSTILNEYYPLQEFFSEYNLHGTVTSVANAFHAFTFYYGEYLQGERNLQEATLFAKYFSNEIAFGNFDEAVLRAAIAETKLPFVITADTIDSYVDYMTGLKKQL